MHSYPEFMFMPFAVKNVRLSVDRINVNRQQISNSFRPKHVGWKMLISQ